MMSDPNPEAADDEGGELQFDQAEMTTPGTGGPNCDACKRPLKDFYFEINGKIICGECRQHIEASLRGGSGLARLLKASVFGFGAAILGAAIYFIIARVTGYNIGLVAILVGFIVGRAVRKGTGNRGGLLYQFLALFLTYVAIGLMDLTFFIEQQVKEFSQKQNQAAVNPGALEKDAAKDKGQPKLPEVASDAKDKAKAVARTDQAPAIDPAPKAPAGAAGKAGPMAENEQKADDAKAGPPDAAGLLGSLLVLGLILVGIVLAAPVLETIHAPISGLIYCFALFQAWQLNKRAHIAFNGPFQVGKENPSGAQGSHDAG
jgi:hypothetical protein